MLWLKDVSLLVSETVVFCIPKADLVATTIGCTCTLRRFARATNPTVFMFAVRTIPLLN
jgi:hypothetical protein